MTWSKGQRTKADKVGSSQNDPFMLSCVTCIRRDLDHFIVLVVKIILCYASFTCVMISWENYRSNFKSLFYPGFWLCFLSRLYVFLVFMFLHFLTGDYRDYQMSNYISFSFIRYTQIINIWFNCFFFFFSVIFDLAPSSINHTSTSLTLCIFRSYSDYYLYVLYIIDLSTSTRIGYICLHL